MTRSGEGGYEYEDYLIGQQVEGIGEHGEQR